MRFSPSRRRTDKILTQKQIFNQILRVSQRSLTQEFGAHQSLPTRTRPNRKCKAKSKTQFEPEIISALGQHLLKSNQWARNYSDSRFKILTAA